MTSTAHFSSNASHQRQVQVKKAATNSRVVYQGMYLDSVWQSRQQQNISSVSQLADCYSRKNTDATHEPSVKVIRPTTSTVPAVPVRGSTTVYSLYTVGFQNKLGANTTVSLLSRIYRRERQPAYIILNQCNATAIYGYLMESWYTDSSHR